MQDSPAVDEQVNSRGSGGVGCCDQHAELRTRLQRCAAEGTERAAGHGPGCWLRWCPCFVKIPQGAHYTLHPFDRPVVPP